MSTPESGTHDAELARLVSTALELREGGREDWLREACAEHPELEAQVRSLVERAQSLPTMIGRTAGLDPWIGRRLSERFRLVERIGAGAMGVVYVADDLELHRRVACKVMRPGLMPPEQALERFSREARAMAAVQHSAVVTIHDRGRTDDEHVYIVMELVDGVALSELLDVASGRERSVRSDDALWLEDRFGIQRRDETSYLRTVVRWAAELAGGLEAVHRAGVLHRDIKPSNVIVRRNGSPVLLDFGIALLDGSSAITRGTTSLGTPSYMPPEALHRDVKRTASSDVYSLAATLYHLVTLHAPYEGTPTQVLTALATREPVPAVRHRPGLPRDLQAILDKGMHRKPGARYASSAEFEADLRAFLEYRPIVARPVTRIERVARRVARSGVALGALVALVCVAGFFGARAWQAHRVETRRGEHAEIARRFPPNFSVVGASNRFVRDPADRAKLAALLDEAAEVAVDPLPTFLLRASFRQDHGDAAGAARDMSEVADSVATPFARALAACYAAADSGQSGARALDLSALPSAETTVDRYLLAYHLLRQEKAADGLRLLAEPDVRGIPHAEELFLAATNFDLLPRAEQHSLALERFADLVRLESRIGARSATTAHIAGRMLVVQGRFEDAIDACAEGIELAPRAHVLRINAGYSALAGRRLVEAREHLEIARSLHPGYKRSVEELIWVEIADRRFDRAQELVRETAPILEPPNDTWGDYWAGVVETYAALDARAKGEAPACEQRVARALARFEHVPGRTHGTDGKPKDTAFRIATALKSVDAEALVLALAELVERDPARWWYRELLAAHMPPDLSPRATEAVRRVIAAFGDADAASPNK